MWSIWVHCPQILLSLRKNGEEKTRLLNLRRLRSSRFMSRVQGRQNFRMQAVKWVVAKLQGDKTTSFSAVICVVAKLLQGDRSASQSSMELYDPWISGPLRVS